MTEHKRKIEKSFKQKSEKQRTETPQKSAPKLGRQGYKPAPKEVGWSPVAEPAGTFQARPKPKSQGPAKASEHEGERVAKFLARAGVCSRRDAERMVAEGRVQVDGKILASPALNITAANKVLVDGKPVAVVDETRVWRLHKPAGAITTSRDPQGRKTVFDLLPVGMPRTITVGRLDYNTEGLLLLTNDGGLARHLELPQNAWVRHYRVRVHGRVDAKRIAALANGVTISGIHYEPMKVVVDKSGDDEKTGGANTWLSVSIREGKNREVRKVMDHLGLQVTRLIRTSFGPFQLGNLARGVVEEVPRRVLREQMGAYLKDQATGHGKKGKGA